MRRRLMPLSAFVGVTALTIATLSSATDLDAFIRNKDIRKEYYGSEFPAATWVQARNASGADIPAPEVINSGMR